MFINTTEIGNNITALKENVKTLTSEYNKINGQIQELKKGWGGTRADAFINYMEKEYLVSLDDSIKKINNYIEYLSKVPATYSLLDECYNATIEV